MLCLRVQMNDSCDPGGGIRWLAVGDKPKSLYPDGISRLGRLEGQVVGTAERVPRMQEELESLRAKMVERTRGFSTMKEG